MSKICSIIPQIANSTGYVDSKLFTQINSDLSSKFKGVELRNKTKEVYNFIQSKDFINIFGDWKLYQHYKLGTMTKEDLNSLNSLYKGDILELEKTLPLHKLNDIFEPIFNFNNNTITNSNGINGIIIFTSEKSLKNISESLNIEYNEFINYIKDSGKDIYFEDSETTSSNKLHSEAIMNTFVDYENLQITEIIDLLSNSTGSRFTDLIESPEFLKLSAFAQQTALANFFVDRLNTLRYTIIDELEKQGKKDIIDYLDKNYNNLIYDLQLVNSNGTRSMVLRSIFSYFSKNYGIKIEDKSELLNLEEEAGLSDFESTEVVNTVWDDSLKMKINLKRNVAQELRLLLAKSVNSAFMSNIQSNVNHTTKFGISKVLSIDELWNTLISISILHNDKQSIIRELEKQNKYIYNGELTEFINTLNTNENLWNSFKSSIILPVLSNRTNFIKTNGNNIIINERENNYRAFASNVANINLINNLSLNLENNSNYVKSFVFNSRLNKDTQYAGKTEIQYGLDLSKDINNSSTLSDNYRYDRIKARLKMLGLYESIQMIDIDMFISNNLSFFTTLPLDRPYSNNLFDKLKKEAENELDESIKASMLENIKYVESEYRNKLIEIDNTLGYIMKGLYDLSVKMNTAPLKNKIEKYGLNFKAEFQQKGSIKFLAKLITYKHYKNSTLAFFNENRDMEYSPQHPSYLTDIAKALIPINGELSYEFAREILSDFLKSPFLLNNTFLYNHDGTGLFNFKTHKNKDNEDVMDLKDGLPILNIVNGSALNTNYLNNVSIFQYSGIKLTNNDIGYKYNNIHGDSWVLQNIQAAARGQYFIASSDSSRLYAIQSLVYGVDNMNFNSNGEYNSIINIMKKAGIYKKDGITKRTIEDIVDENGLLKDDAIFYFDENDEYLGIKDFIILSGKEIKDIIERPIDNKVHLVSILRTLYHNIILISENNKEYFNVWNKAIKIMPTINSFIDSDGNVNVESIDKNTTEESLHNLIRESLSLLLNIESDILNNKDYLQLILNPENIEAKSKSVQLMKDTLLDKDKNIVSAINGYYSILSKKKILSNNVLNPINLLSNDTELIAKYKEFSNSIQVRHIKKSIETEVDVMAEAIDNMFILNESIDSKNNKFISSITIKDGIQEKANNGNKVPYPKLTTDKRKSSTFDKSTGKEILGDVKILDNGLPTGRAFKFHRLTYIEDNKKVNLETYARKNGYITSDKYSMLELVLKSKTDSKFKDILDKLIVEFIDSWFTNTQRIYLDKMSNFEYDLKNMVVSNQPKKVLGTFDKRRSEKEEIGFSYLVNVPEAKIRTKKNIEKDAEEDATDNEEVLVKDRTSNSSEQIDRHYKRFTLSIAITDYLNHVNIGEDLLFGRQYEYKDDIEINKRVNEVIRNGKSNGDNTYYNSVVIDDVETVTNMLDVMSKVFGVDEAFKRYGQDIEIGNGLSMITVDELITRLKNTNNYEKLKPYIDSLLYSDKPNYDDYLYIVEQLKYFMYDRQLSHDNIVKGDMASYQEKNSTIVLFPKLFKNTSYELISEWMVNRDIHLLNFKSSAKVGGSPSFRLHDIFGEFKKVSEDKSIKKQWVRTNYELRTTLDNNGKQVIDDRINPDGDYSDENRINISDYIVKHKRSSIRIQQDTVGHLLNEKGTFSIQWIKKLFTNMINDEKYVINGISYSGKTNNEQEQGLFELFHYALSTNAKHDRNKLLSKWGALKNGKVKYDAYGNIDIDLTKVMEYIQDYFYNSGNLPYFRAFDSTNGTLHNTLSINSPLISKQVTQLLLSGISKTVNQKIGQVHAVGMPDVFIQPKGWEYRKNNIKVLQDFSDMSMFSFDKDFLERHNVYNEKGELKKDANQNINFELRAEDTTTGQLAEIVLNVWDSQFEEYRKTKTVTNSDGTTYTVEYIDIDEIPDESRIVVGTRIPNEGSQTTFVAKVVGFMNTRASQVIVPKHGAKRTGWDYDIDTVYIYTRHLYKNENNKLVPISYQNDVNNDKSVSKNIIYNTYDRMILNFIQNYYEEDYTKLIVKRNIELQKAYDKYKESIENEINRSMFLSQKVFKELSKTLNQLNNTSSVTLKIELQSKIDAILEDIAVKVADSLNSLENSEFLESNMGYKALKSLLEAHDNNKGDIKLRNTFDTSLTNILRYFENEKEYGGVIDLKDYLKEIETSILDTITNTELSLNKTNDETYSAYSNPLYAIGKNITKEAKKELRTQFNLEKANIQIEFENSLNILKNNEDVVSSFNELDSFEKLTRKTRENIIVDIIIAKNSKHSSTEYIEKPNEYTHTQKVYEGVNIEFGLDTSLTNFANIFDRASFANQNKGISVMKGQEVVNQNTISILGSLKAHLGKNAAIPITMKISEFKSYTDELSIKDALDRLLGRGNYIFIKNDKNINDSKFIIFSNYLGNNATGNWRNINGEYITDQSSELLSNILDAVKFRLGFNVNTNTLNIVSILANMPINHYTDLYNNGTKTTNSYAYSSMLLHQGIISKYVSRINNLSRLGITEYNDRSLMFTKNEVISNIIKLIGSYNFSSISDINLLDIFKKYILELEDVTINKEHFVAIIETWNNAITRNEDINVYDKAGTSFDLVFNSFISFIKSDDLVNTLDTFGDLDSKLISEFLENNKTVKDINVSSSSIFKVINEKYDIDKSNLQVFKTLDELHDIYTYGLKNNYHDIDKAMTSTKNDNIKNKIKFINYLSDQIDIHRLYTHIHKSSELLSKSNNVLKTDKLGASPDTSISNKLFEDMSKLRLDFDRFISDLKGYSNSELNSIKNQYYTPSKEQLFEDGIIESKELAYDTIQRRLNYIARLIHKHNNSSKTNKTKKIDDKGTTIVIPFRELKMENYVTPIYIDDTNRKGTTTKKNIVDVIFPEVVQGNTNENFNYKNSKYPYLQAQYVYTNNLSRQALANITLKENPNFRILLNGIFNELKINSGISQLKRLELENAIVNILINEYLTINVPFLNGDNSILDTDYAYNHKVEKERILGVIDKNREGLISLIDYGKYTNQENGLLEFSKLSTSNKVGLIMINPQTYGIKGELYDFLSMLELNTNKKDKLNNGYERISLKSNDLNNIKLQDNFLKLFYNDNIFVRDMARDLIRYTFIAHGLQFGNNLSKFIAPSLFYEKPNETVLNTFPELNNPYNQFWIYNESMVNFQNIMKDDTTHFDIQDIRDKVNIVLPRLYENRTLSPLVDNRKSKYNPTFTHIEIIRYADGSINTDIIKESKDRVANSIYSDRISIQIKTDKGIRTYKRYSPIEDYSSPYYYYYPIDKILLGEFNIDSTNSSSINKSSKILSEETYISQLDSIVNNEGSSESVLYSEYIYNPNRTITGNSKLEQNTEDIEYTRILTKSNKSYSETAKDILNNVDNVLYIGNNSFYKNAFKSEKTIYSSIENLDYDTLKILDGKSDIKLAIVGDTLSDNKYTKKQLHDLVYTPIQFYLSEYDVIALKSIYKLGVGEVVFNSTFTHDLPTEFIELGEKDNVLYSEFIDSNVRSSILNVTSRGLNDFVSQQQKIAGIMASIRKDIGINKPDRFIMKQDKLEDLYKNLPSEIKQDLLGSEISFEMIKDSIDMNIEFVNKILEYILNDKVDFPKYMSGENSFNPLDITKWNMQNVALGNNQDAKVNSLNKLLLYSHLLKAAEEALDIKTISYPILNETILNSIADEETRNLVIERVDNLTESIKSINALINDIHLALARDMNDVPLVPTNTDKPESSQIGNRIKLYTNIKQQVKSQIGIFYSTVSADYTRNAKFKNSKYSKTVDYINSPDFDSSKTLDFELTSEEIAEMYNVLMTYNDDITTIQSLLDSIRNTGIPIIDNTFRLWTEFKIENSRRKDNRNNKLLTILKKYYGDSFNGKDLNWNSSRAAYIKTNLIDSNTGTLLTPYQWQQFWYDIEDFYNAKHKLGEEYELYFGNDKNNDKVFKVKNAMVIANQAITIVPSADKAIKNLLSKSIIEEFNRQLISKNTDFIKNILNNKIDDNTLNLYKVYDLEDSDGKIYSLSININGTNKITVNDFYLKTSYGWKTKQQIYDDYTKEAISETDDEFADLEEINEVYAEDENSKYELNSELYFYRKLYRNKFLYEDKRLKEAYERNYNIKFIDKNSKKIVRNKDTFGNQVNEDAILDMSNIRVYRVVPKSKYNNPEFNKLNDKDKIFIKEISRLMQDVILEVFPEKVEEPGFIPYVFIQTKDNILDLFKKLFGVVDLQEENVNVDAFGNPVNYIKSDSLTPVKLKDIISKLYKQQDESYIEFEKRSVDKANEKLNKLKAKHKYETVEEFKTIEDITSFNRNIIKESSIKNQEHLNYDLPSTMNFLFDELYKHKTHKDFVPVYENLKNLLGSDEFHVRFEKDSHGLLKYIRFGETNYSYKKGIETEAYKRFVKAEPIIYEQSRVNTKVDQILGASLRFTSMNVMFWNWTTGVKNVMKGYSDMIIESNAKQYLNRKELGKGTNMYLHNLPDFITSKMTKIITTKETAVLNLLERDFEDHNEGKLKKQTGGIGSKIVNFTEASGYGIMTGGEHFMQMSMGLVLLNSHRLVNGVVMSKGEFIGYKLKTILDEILNDEQKVSLNKYLEESESNPNNKFRATNYVQYWINKNRYLLSIEQNKLLAQKAKEYETQSLKEFESKKLSTNEAGKTIEVDTYTKIYDLYSFKDGSITKSDKLSNSEEVYMLDRIKRLNQSMHGVYNTIDRSAIQNTLIGEVIMQFRKWMWSSWTRYMGVRVNMNPLKRKDNQPFDEALNRNREGAFIELFRFLNQPLYTRLMQTKESQAQNPKLAAFKLIFSSMGDVMTYWKSNYAILTENQKADVRRGAMFFANITVITLALLMIGSIGYDDDDRNRFHNNVIQIMSGLQTEYSDMLPIWGWLTFYRRTTQSVVPMERQIGTVAKLVYNIAAYPFRTDKQRNYSTGQYKGESKISINVQQLIPIWRQYFKQQYLQSQINYYKMYNPVTNMIN